jgi:hypothetical protein
MNLMTVDAEKLLSFIADSHSLWNAPVQGKQTNISFFDLAQ